MLIKKFRSRSTSARHHPFRFHPFEFHRAEIADARLHPAGFSPTAFHSVGFPGVGFHSGPSPLEFPPFALPAARLYSPDRPSSPAKPHLRTRTRSPTSGPFLPRCVILPTRLLSSDGRSYGLGN